MIMNGEKDEWLLMVVLFDSSTSAGVLVVNVTWRNKTYVGTLLDCTKHDWAPPRYTWDLSLGPFPPPPFSFPPVSLHILSARL